MSIIKMGGNKNFKKRGQAGSRGGCLKNGGAGTPLKLCGYKNKNNTYYTQFKFYLKYFILSLFVF